MDRPQTPDDMPTGEYDVPTCHWCGCAVSEKTASTVFDRLFCDDECQAAYLEEMTVDHEDDDA